MRVIFGYVHEDDFKRLTKTLAARELDDKTPAVLVGMKRRGSWRLNNKIKMEGLGPVFRYHMPYTVSEAYPESVALQKRN
jgi:hypothetical protein